MKISLCIFEKNLDDKAAELALRELNKKKIIQYHVNNIIKENDKIKFRAGNIADGSVCTIENELAEGIYLILLKKAKDKILKNIFNTENIKLED